MPADTLWLRAADHIGIAPGARVIAICMSAEPILAILVARGAEIHACDWHWAALGAAATVLPADRLLPWYDTPPAPAGHFDVALCDLAHLAGRVAFTDAVRLATRVLRPGGRLLVRGGNAEGIGGAARRLRDWFGAADPIAYGGGARVIASPAYSCHAPVTEEPPEEVVSVTLGGVALTLRTAPGVFARGLPDAATRLLADTLARRRADLRGVDRACDLGCGGGALGLFLLGLGIPRCVLVDENLRAVAAAQENLRRNGMKGRGEAVAGDATAEIPGGRYALIVCNPPFHAGPHADRDLGRAIVRAAWGATAPGGVLFVVSHRFLRYDRDVPGLIEVASAEGFSVRRRDRPVY